MSGRKCKRTPAMLPAAWLGDRDARALLRFTEAPATSCSLYTVATPTVFGGVSSAYSCLMKLPKRAGQRKQAFRGQRILTGDQARETEFPYPAEPDL